MKISYRTHPILKCIDEESLGKIHAFTPDHDFFSKNVEFFTSVWKGLIPYFKKEINVVSKSFTDAAKKSEQSLINLYEDILYNRTGKPEDLHVEAINIKNECTHFLYHTVNDETGDIDCVLFVFTNEGIPLCFYCNNTANNKEKKWISDELEYKEEGVDKIIFKGIWETVIELLFKKYADIDTKYLPPGKKVSGVGCKYKNETMKGVTYLESSWFTELVKSDGFTVRGHFRLQPKKKDGKWTRELIWINDFQKSGYRRRAKKEIYEND